MRSALCPAVLLKIAVAFTGEGKLVRKATGYEQKSRSLTIRPRVRRLREPSFPAPFERISDPQIPLTRHNSERMVENLEAIVAVATLKDFR